MNIKIVNEDISDIEVEAIGLPLLDDASGYKDIVKNSNSLRSILKDGINEPIINIIGEGRAGEDLILVAINNNELLASYRAIIDFSIEKGYKSLGLPLIGGSIGFNKGEEYNLLTSLLMEYLNKGLSLNIVISLYTKNEPRLLRCSRLIGGEDYREVSEAPSFIPKNILASVTINKLFNEMKTEEMLIPYGRIDNPMSFIDEYLEQNKIKKGFLFVNGIGKDDCSRFRTGRKQMKKSHIYKMAIVLGFNRTELLQLMSFAGYSFNPNDSLDIFMHDYYLENSLARNMGEFQSLYYDNNIEIFDLLYNE